MGLFIQTLLTILAIGMFENFYNMSCGKKSATKPKGLTKLLYCELLFELSENSTYVHHLVLVFVEWFLQ